MKRIEIIANRSIEEDLFEALGRVDAAAYYTKIPVVFGIGKSGPRMGNHIWPEENFILIVYCNEEEAKRIRTAISELKSFFTTEGIKIFEMEAS